MQTHGWPRWRRIALQLLAVAAPLIPRFWSLGRFWDIALSTPVFYWVFRTLYDNLPACYFVVTRIRLWLSNSVVQWTLSMVVPISDNPSLLKEIRDGIIEADPECVSWQNETYEKIINLTHWGGAARIRMVPSGSSVPSVMAQDQEDAKTLLVLQLTDFHIPFRESKSTLEFIKTLINDEILSRTGRASVKCTFKAYFGQANPYFGLFLRQLNFAEQDLVSFDCSFIERVGYRKDEVTVTKDNITLVTDSFSALMTLAQRYITLASFHPSSPHQV